jgi:superfamily II DNA or RNA helicase
MSKITRYGYLIDRRQTDPELLEKIKIELTLCPRQPPAYAHLKRSVPIYFYQEQENYLAVPKYYGLAKLGPPARNLLEESNYPMQDVRFTGSLRPRQHEIARKLINGLKEHRGGLLVAYCGIGKTVLAIYLACHFRLKTLFIVHKTFLKNQVRERILANTNVRDVGVLQGSRVEADHAFVVGMTQSLIRHDYPALDDFGMVIIDEVHHMAAQHFSRVLQKVSARYLFGLSAENTRNDGLYKVLHWYLGPLLHEEPQRANEKVIVKRFFFRTVHQQAHEILINRYTHEPDQTAMVNRLVALDTRNRFIRMVLKILYRMGRKTLCLTGRLSQIEHFRKKLEKYNVGCYIGGLSEEKLAISAGKQIILGTYHMAQEGLDIPDLNVVVLATPKTAVRQSIGRILRRETYEINPMIIDLVDKNAVFKRQARLREYYYHRHAFQVEDYHVTDDESPDQKEVGIQDTQKLRKILESVQKKSRVTYIYQRIDPESLDFVS